MSLAEQVVRGMAVLAVIFLLWAGVVALAIATALRAGYQGTTPAGDTPTREGDDDAAAS